VATPLLLLQQFFYPTIQCNCSACNVPPDAGLHKRDNFPTQIVGPAGTEDQNRATYVAGSGASLSGIHYDFTEVAVPVAFPTSVNQSRIYYLVINNNFSTILLCLTSASGKVIFGLEGKDGEGKGDGGADPDRHQNGVNLKRAGNLN
jgi:hypothetical protein